MSSWCEMGWNLGFFLNEVVDKVSVTLFPQRNSHPSKLIIIASLKHPNPSGHFLFLLSCPCYYSAIIPENTVLYEIPVFFFSTTYTQQEYCIFSVPTAVSKLLYFITLQCTSWLNHLLSSSHKYCTSTYCLKYNFFEGSS